MKGSSRGSLSTPGVVAVSEVLSALPFCDLSRFAFLAGSGISVSSGLPSGWEFNTAIARFLADSPVEAEELRSLLVAGYGSDQHAIRFEQLMYILRERTDPGLEVLKCFDTGSPSTLHCFLAHALRNGAYVLTTNFDSLIESAFTERGPDPALVQVHLESGEGNESLICCSFERYLALGLPQPAVLKLHGSLRHLHPRTGSDPEDLPSVAATLDRIGTSEAAMRLEPHKHSTLALALHGRILCVLGYSGTDDFDVIPSLADALHGAAGILWLRHERQRLRCFSASSPEGIDVLPLGLRNVALGRLGYVICGPTEQIVAALFGFTDERNPPHPVAIGELLRSLQPYRRLTPAHKKIIAGRISEEAMRPAMAMPRYAHAVELSRRRDSPACAYALFRCGHISRTLCKDSEALVFLNRSLRIFRRLGDRANAARVLNAIANVFLVRGVLSRAERYYDTSLAEAVAIGNRRLQATILNNIGLVCKKRGDLQRAVQFYDRALLLDEEILDRPGMARELGNKINALLLLERYQEALAVCDEVGRLQRLLGRLDMLANLLASRSIALRHLGRLDEADEAAEAALKVETDLGNREGIARCCSLKAGVAESRRSFEEAINRYRDAIAAQRELGRLEGVAVDLESMAGCYYLLGEHTSAAAAFRESQESYRRLGNRSKAKQLTEKIREAVKAARRS